MTRLDNTNLRASATEIVQRELKDQITPLFFGTKLSLEQQTYQRGKPRPYLEAVIQILTLMRAETIVEIAVPTPW